MSMAQVKYIKVSGERISEQNKKAYGITRESSLYKNIAKNKLSYKIHLIYGIIN